MENQEHILRDIHWTEYGHTVLHPFAVLLLVVMFIFLLQSRSHRFLVPFLVVAAFTTHMQRLVIGSIDFSLLRILMIGGVLRGLLRNDAHQFKWEKIDIVIISYVGVLSFAYVVLRSTASAVVNRLGFGFDTLVFFFLIRVYIHSIDQIKVFIRALAYVFVIVAVFMTIEQVTQHNFFSILGGVSHITPVREGRIRAQGAFSHSIMAGTFGAAFIPVFWGFWHICKEEEKNVAVTGILSGLVIVWASSSSGPVLSLLAGIFAIYMWKLRTKMRWILFATIVGFVFLSLLMDSPVWHLLARIDIVGGSTGWHRYFLIDQTIHRFREWALMGVLTTGHWGWGLNDVTNMYVAQAVDGGIVTLFLFVVLIGLEYRSIGLAIKNNNQNTRMQKFFWSWGAVLFVHCVSFIGVSYFGQMNLFWILTLGIITSLPGLMVNVSPAAETGVRVGRE